MAITEAKDYSVLKLSASNVASKKYYSLLAWLLVIIVQATRPQKCSRDWGTILAFCFSVCERQPAEIC